MRKFLIDLAGSFLGLLIFFGTLAFLMLESLTWISPRFGLWGMMGWIVFWFALIGAVGFATRNK